MRKESDPISPSYGLNSEVTEHMESEVHKMSITKILKRPFCKHCKTKYTGQTYLEESEPGKMRTRHIHKCLDCGKEIHH
jgi:RNase P subunit RPR2